jgi:hypothetical protein
MRKLLFAFVVFGLSSTKLLAQYGYGNPISIPVPVQVPSLLYDRGDQKSEEPNNASLQSRTAPATPVNLRFTPNVAQRRQNLATFVAEVTKVTPDYAPKLAAELGDGSVFGQYGQLLRTLDLDANNVADNMAVWWLHAWEASAGRPITVPDSAYGVVKAQVQRMLANAKMAAMSNADKQKMADDFMIRTLIMANQIDQAKTSAEFAKQLAFGTRKSVKAAGLDFDKMTLTEKGFVSVKGGKEK